MPLNPPQVRPYIPPPPQREELASAYAAEKLGLRPGVNYLGRKDAGKYRQAFTDAYMEIGRRMGCAVIVEVLPQCVCSARPYPHRHSDNEKRRFAMCAAPGEM